MYPTPSSPGRFAPEGAMTDASCWDDGGGSSDGDIARVAEQRCHLVVTRTGWRFCVVGWVGWGWGVGGNSSPPVCLRAVQCSSYCPCFKLSFFLLDLICTLVVVVKLMVTRLFLVLIVRFEYSIYCCAVMGDEFDGLRRSTILMKSSK